MGQKLINTINSSKAVSCGLLVLLIFIVAMKQPVKEKDLENKPYTYLALGDSYTIGEQVQNNSNFPNQVIALLRQKGFDFSDPLIIARTGWTTDDLQAAIAKLELQQQYDFVTLLIGVNNQYRGRPVADYILEFESLLKQAIQFAGNDTGHVIVLSIPDWGVTPFAEGRDRKQIAGEIDAYNHAGETISSRYKVHYIYITSSTRLAAKDPSLLASDGLHPSEKEYAKWAKQVAEQIQRNLPGQ